MLYYLHRLYGELEFWVTIALFKVTYYTIYNIKYYNLTRLYRILRPYSTTYAFIKQLSKK